MALVLGLAGCQTVPTARQVVSDGQAALDAAPLCCASLAQAQRQSLPLAEPVTLEISATAQAFNFGGHKAFFLLFELPAYTQPYSLVITSRAAGGLNDAALFIPRVALYDDTFQIARYFDEKTLRNRGNNLERTVFINPDNRNERYLAVHGSDLSSRIERAYSMVTVTPVMAGPVMFNILGGVDGKSTLHSSPVGSLHMEVRGLTPPASAPVR